MFGSPVIHAATSLVYETSSLRLAEYANILGLNECGMWGVNDGVSSGCNKIWRLSQRKMVARYLQEAQTEIENLIQYPLGIRWITEKKRRYLCPGMAEWGYVVEPGIMAVTDISLAEVPDYTADPAVIGPVATTVTDEDEIHIFHHDTDAEINPSKITIAGGNVTIEVPWCRMVDETYSDTPEAGLNYADAATWGEDEVDVKRIYNDKSTEVVLTSNHQCNALCSADGCSEYSLDACMYISNPRLGIFEALPASYAGGSWTRTTLGLCCSDYREMQANYLAGVPLDEQKQDTIMRLAHSKMPVEPCGCDPARKYWERDRNQPEVITAERMNCEFGLMDGAWYAYKFALSMQLTRGALGQ